MPKLMNNLLTYKQKASCQLTPNAYTYLRILETLVKVNVAQLAPQDVCQCFLLKSTIRKYFFQNKRGFWVPFANC